MALFLFVVPGVSFAGLIVTQAQDIAGGVVDTQVAKLENLAAGSTGAFEVKSDKPKIAARRYAPLK